MTKIGRNDPCPCGSGKKYKHCCMRKARQRRRARLTSAAPRKEQGPAASLDQVRSMARQLMPHLSDDEAQELQETLQEAEEIETYHAMIDQIEAAGRELEAHSVGFEDLMSDTAASIERSFELFSEERFASMRYTVEDVHRAFEEVGYPSRTWKEFGEEEMDTLVAAMVHLAGDEYQRMHLARQLLMAMPEYVAAGRYLDAWLIQYSAYRMTEVPGESNPFLFVMFNLAFEEWALRMEAHEEELLSELGIDASELADMDAEEFDTLLTAHMADPSRDSLLEAYYEAHSMFRDLTRAEAGEVEHESVLLLEREDADWLYLSSEEVQPWVSVLLERLEAAEARAKAAVARGEWDDAEVLEELGRTMAEVAQEMAPAIFTPQRVEWLVDGLEDYRRRLLERQERDAANLARVARMRLELKHLDPAETPLLVGICFASLREAAIALSGARAGTGPAPLTSNGREL